MVKENYLHLLKPELQDHVYLLDEPGGFRIHHPHVDILNIYNMYDKDSVRSVNTEYDLKTNFLNICLDRSDYYNYIKSHSLYFQIPALKSLTGITYEEYWEIALKLWFMSTSTTAIESQWRDLFSTCEEPRLFMGEVNYEQYMRLPDYIKIYRGQSGESVESFSWTLDTDIANIFASRHKDGVILYKTVNKNQCFAFINDRTEKEVILLKDC